MSEYYEAQTLTSGATARVEPEGISIVQYDDDGSIKAVMTLSDNEVAEIVAIILLKQGLVTT